MLDDPNLSLLSDEQPDLVPDIKFESFLPRLEAAPGPWRIQYKPLQTVTRAPNKWNPQGSSYTYGDYFAAIQAKTKDGKWRAVGNTTGYNFNNEANKLLFIQSRDMFELLDQIGQDLQDMDDHPVKYDHYTLHEWRNEMKTKIAGVLEKAVNRDLHKT